MPSLKIPLEVGAGGVLRSELSAAERAAVDDDDAWAVTAPPAA